MLPTLRLQLAALIVDSLGDPAFYRASIDKTMIGPAAAAPGLRVPPSIVVTRLDDAADFIAAQGFPIVLKRSHSTAGEGVAVCADGAARPARSGEEHFCAHFAQEWPRDPQSPPLSRMPVDVPWDELRAQ